MFKCSKYVKKLAKEKMIEDANILTWVFLKAILTYEEKKVPLEAIVLVCIRQNSFYLYTLNDMKGCSLVLLFMCDISEMSNVIYKECVGKYEISFEVKGSQLQCSFKKRKYWKKTKKIIEEGEKNAII